MRQSRTTVAGAGTQEVRFLSTGGIAASGDFRGGATLRYVLAVSLMLAGLALIVIYKGAPIEYSEAAMRWWVLAHWTLVLVYVLLRRLIFGPLNFLGPDMLFSAATLVFVIGSPTLIVLGMLPFEYRFFPALHHNTRTLIFSLMVLTAFLAGYNCIREIPSMRLRIFPRYRINYDSALLLGKVLIATAFAVKLIFIGMAGVATLFGEGYNLRHFEGSVLTMLGSVAFMSGVIITAVSSALGYGRLVHGVSAKILIIAYLGIFAVFGGRGHLAVLIGLMAVYGELLRRIRTVVLVGGVVALLGVFVTIPVLRRIPGRSLREFRAVAGEQLPFYGIGGLLAEGIGPYKTLNYTLGYVPQYFAYRKGKDYLFPLVTVLPWTKKAVYRAVGHVEPARWATFNIHEPTFRRGGGFGYTMAGEFYLNFGVYGAYIAALILGVAMQKLRVVALTRGTPLWLLFYFLMLTLMTLWVRASFDNITRPLVWGMVLCWAALGVGRSEGSISVPRRAGNAAAVKRAPR